MIARLKQYISRPMLARAFAMAWSFLLLYTFSANARCQLTYKWQASAWMQYYNNSNLPVSFGACYIPQLNYLCKIAKQRQFDFEAAANLWGADNFYHFDENRSEGEIKPYRVYGRYATERLELRLGLQKINFGSAVLLRPLMWFDRMDARDPLKLSDGVWGLLARRYFDNNANIWLWGLYGNEGVKAWEIAPTSEEHPEFGGRLQAPVPNGEVGLSYHHRTTDITGMPLPLTTKSLVPENRLGLDGKWDLGVGFWLEGVWINKRGDVGLYGNQKMAVGGMDYTFGIGNGLYASFEQMLTTLDHQPLSFSNQNSVSAVSLDYPLGLFDQLSFMAYSDWTSGSSSYLLNWKKQIKDVSLYLITFWDMGDGAQQTNVSNGPYSGRGLQILATFNH